MPKMLALKTFLGRGNEAAGEPSGAVVRGREFDCVNDTRAGELEKKGLARLVGAAAKARPAAKRKNAAAAAGPLPSAGGAKTGAAGQSSSSLPGLQPPARAKRSTRRKRGAAAGGPE